ncbi:hypothetical protein PHLCEN_2v125 [Hermanssonia centrifuga]|uniref:Uncharacterized protein n=1 Tax=Hermanssonia centrifuga TaxID=98765 RepID=A0A2R6S6W4_9APHY|nr:hypothetical protein PHLCEN_2v125 [Hermanssonia centrifuga]
MAVFYDEIPDDERLVEWVKAQKIFHVATAPLKGQPSPTGRVIERDTPEFDAILQSDNSDDDKSIDYPTPEMLPGVRAIIWLDITKVGSSCGYSVPFMQFIAHSELTFFIDVKFIWRLYSVEGNALNDTMNYREVNDEHNDNPFALHHKKGLQSYWVFKNSWSIDGLPGLRRPHIADRVTPDVIKSAMAECGLKFDAMKSGRGRAFGSYGGVLLGIFLTLLAQRVMGLLAGRFTDICIANHCLLS